MKHEDVPRDDVWAAARFIWENTPKITYRELMQQLEEVYGKDAPKSISSVTKKRNKEGWEKTKLIETVKIEQKPRTKQGENKKKSEQSEQENNFVLTETNKAGKVRTSEPVRTKTAKVEQIINDLVVNKEKKAALILKTRKRLANVGGLSDSVLDVLSTLVAQAFDAGVDPEEIQKALVLSDALSTSLDKMARVVKIIAETELPLSGITPDDLQESEQDRRLGALDKLKGIHEAENAARAAKLPELQERLRRMEVMNYDMDGGFADDVLSDNDDIEEIDFTAVDDD